MELPENLTVFCRVYWWPKGRVWIEKEERKGRITLVKVRIPEATDEDLIPQALVYNGDRSLVGFLPVEDGLRKAMGGRTKGYFFARQGKGKTLRLYGRAANQDW